MTEPSGSAAGSSSAAWFQNPRRSKNPRQCRWAPSFEKKIAGITAPTGLPDNPS